ARYRTTDAPEDRDAATGNAHRRWARSKSAARKNASAESTLAPRSYAHHAASAPAGPNRTRWSRVSHALTSKWTPRPRPKSAPPTIAPPRGTTPAPLHLGRRHASHAGRTR